MVILGTRPDTIKLAPVIAEFKKWRKIKLIIVTTAQHREMFNQVLEVFSLEPDYDLNIMEENQTLEDIVRRSIGKLGRVTQKENPHFILIQGDTTTAFVGALVGFYNRVPIGHIEAGLRTYCKFFPFPEELNRRLISHLSDFHFAPTHRARANLLKEGITKNIYVTGNTIVDALKMTIEKDYQFSHRFLNQLEYHRKKVIILTAHRRENLGENLRNILHAVRQILKKWPEIEIVFPVHLNPKVRKDVFNILSENSRCHLVPPLNYKDFVNLMAKVWLILTDSGGIQEEAPILGLPVFVLRDVTERPEGVATGNIKVIGTKKDQIIQAIAKILNNNSLYQKMSRAASPYGDGRAAQRVVEVLLKEFGIIKRRKLKEFRY